MSAFLLVSAFLALVSPTKAPITVNVDAKSGDTLVGERTFKVTVKSQNIVSQVEFYVGDELRDSATSTPYLFTLDTLNEPDGDLKLRFKGYTTQSETGETTIVVHVDNGLSKGVDWHVKKGQDFLSDSKWPDAINEGRIALKIDNKSNAARLILARANIGLNVFDKAQKYAEDAVAQDGNDVQALSLLSGINLRRALRTVVREGADVAEAQATMREAIKAAVESRRKALDVEIEKVGPLTADNLLPYADAAIRGQRYSLAIQALAPELRKQPTNAAIADRLAYAWLRNGRTTEALQALSNFKKVTPLDAYGDALLAVAAIDANDDSVADAAIQDGLLNDSQNLGLRTAQAYIALKRNKVAVVSQVANDLAKEQGQRADVNYFLNALANRQQRFGDARRYFERSVLAEPAFPDLYIEQANYAIDTSTHGKLEQKDLDRQYESARVMYESALIARPESAEALSGLSVVALLQKKPVDALKFANAAVSAAPANAGAYYALSAAAAANRRLADSQNANNKAGALDKKNLEGRSIPDALAVWRYLNTAGRSPILSAPQ